MAKSKSRIGFDPLAWMKGPSPRAEADPSPRNETPAARPAAVAKPTPAPAAGGPAVISLGEELLIADVGARHQEWMRAMAGAQKLELDGSRLARVDTAGLQLLTALVHEAKRNGVDTHWRSASAGLRDTAGRLGLAITLGLS